jgi:hypothetical protein
METGSRQRVDGQSTYFAPPEREPPAVVAEQIARIIAHPVVATVLESYCGQVLVLNRERQILAASKEFHDALSACGIHDFVGLRPGEAIGCEHAGEGPGGCGTSLACQHCGAVAAILAAQCCLSPVYEECWITMRRKHGPESVEFRAKATPLRLGGLDLIVFVLHDISDQKRRRILEHRFLHDARNLLSGIVTWSEVIASGEPSVEATSSLKELALELRDLLSEHALLALAETGELQATRAPIDLDDLSHILRDGFSERTSGKGKHLLLRFPTEARPPASDKVILLRILSNMISNALEATDEGGTVEVSYDCRDGTPRFSVHNPGAIPEEIVQRVFQRSFTTKTEPGHGLGTYSMRLLAERYLDGRVVFDSTAQAGTTFSVILTRS